MLLDNQAYVTMFQHPKHWSFPSTVYLKFFK